MKNYFKRLKEHPGLGMAIVITIMAFFAGASNKSFHVWWHGGIFGLICACVLIWSIILISNFKK